MTPRLLLNSTKPKDYARNAREEMRGVVCVCVLFSTPLCIYSREPRGEAFTTDVGDQWGDATCPVEAVGPTGQVGRPGRSVGLPGPKTAPNFFWQTVLGLLV